ncbi:Uma2 family endonuclease [Micromonospora sp. R77]|uniref:Uma2 family endonuclease n=1 Tax=Micromonospora sp. R77 TaxID=2925836 RepID=UPI001F622085|nr:Uma2 family endonuclease [Micromonospora sp. R77]MCI4063214.1 Uma2 family endonuclease [Micromonospora sp. R77]
MAMPQKFDPLYDLDGEWTTQLADRFLPTRELPDARYECVDGRLVMTPADAGANSFGEAKLIRILGPAAEAAGLYVYGQVNLTFNPRSWIQPDLTVLHTVPKTDDEDRWVPGQYCTMAVEFVSPAGRQQDFVDKPRRCAENGVPYFMRVEIVRRLRHVSVELHSLGDAGAYVPLAAATGGHRLQADVPFAIDFDPAELLP